MKRPRGRAQPDERGAALILAIAFLVVVGGIGGTLLASITSGIKDRHVLDGARDRQYAADAAIEVAIKNVRAIGGAGPALAACGPYTNPAINNVNIRVDCSGAPTLTFTGFLQRNVVFTVCVDTGVPCTESTTVIRAQVNYETAGSGTVLQVTRTWIQAWSVNG